MSVLTTSSTRGMRRGLISQAPVGVAQLLVGWAVVVGVPGGAHHVHDVAVGDSKGVLERGNVPFRLDEQRELGAGAHHAVGEQIVAVLLGVAGAVVDHGELLVHNHA